MRASAAAAPMPALQCGCWQRHAPDPEPMLAAVLLPSPPTPQGQLPKPRLLAQMISIVPGLDKA